MARRRTTTKYTTADNNHRWEAWLRRAGQCSLFSDSDQRRPGQSRFTDLTKCEFRQLARRHGQNAIVTYNPTFGDIRIEFLLTPQGL